MSDIDIGSKALEHLKHLAVEIGPRSLGSAANQAAAEYIRSVFEASGLDVEMQELPCPAWEDLGSHLELGGERMPAAANTWSPPCDLVAPALPIGTVTELEQADLAGRFAILYGEMTKDHGLGARKAFYFPENHQEIVALLERKEPAALITINPKPGCFERLIRDWEFPIPSAMVTPQVGLRLLEHSNQELRVSIASRQSPGGFHNVVASKSGAGGGRVMFLAHFDTQAGTPGAIDNGSGVGVLLTLAESLAHRQFPFSLEWLAVNGEEVGGVGDVEYLRQRDDTLDEFLAVINMDGIGQRLGVNGITTMGCSQAFEDLVREAHRAYPGVVWGDPWYESDHTAFLMRGVPCIPMGSVGVTDVLHCPTDTIEWVSPQKLGEVASLVTEIVEALGGKTPKWCRVSN